MTTIIAHLCSGKCGAVTIADERAATCITEDCANKAMLCNDGRADAEVQCKHLAVVAWRKHPLLRRPRANPARAERAALEVGYTALIITRQCHEVIMKDVARHLIQLGLNLPLQVPCNATTSTLSWLIKWPSDISAPNIPRHRTPCTGKLEGCAPA